MRPDTAKGYRIRERRRKRERAAIIERNKAEFAAMQERHVADEAEFQRRQRQLDAAISASRIAMNMLPALMMAAAIAPTPKDCSAPIAIPAPPPWWKRVLRDWRRT